MRGVGFAARRLPLALLAVQLLGVSGQVHTAIAVIRASTGHDFATEGVDGTVKFEQSADDPLGDVTVTVDIKNLAPGVHGFHVHQFGDTRSTSDLSTLGAHFVPYCTPPDIVDEDTQADDPCSKDQQHGNNLDGPGAERGWPPSEVRQPGDMGNITVGADGTVRTTLVLGQQKMSLSDRLKSIIGRTVVVHARADDGKPPYGNAGLPVAYGIIGIARPADGSDTNGAQAPRIPTVSQVICTFEKAPVGHPEAHITGFALLTLQEPDRPNIVRMQAVLDGFEASTQHSFHFHTWGDMSVGYTELGEIYRSEGIEVHELAVNAEGQGVFDDEYESSSLLQHVGRSLTVHEGPSRSTPTIAAAACGLAYPGATLDTGTEAGGSSAPVMSAGAVAVLAISSGAALVVLGVLLCYCFRLPIPCCGSHALFSHKEFDAVPPPPPGVRGAWKASKKRPGDPVVMTSFPPPGAPPTTAV